MDVHNADEHEAAYDAPLFRLIRHIEERLGQTVVLLCKACKSTGMCDACGGNGRYYVRGRGMFDCTVCCGDGACVRCAGTGQLPHA